MGNEAKYSIIAFIFFYLLSAIFYWYSPVHNVLFCIDALILMYYLRKLYNYMFTTVYFGSDGYFKSLLATFLLAGVIVMVLQLPIVAIYEGLGIPRIY